MSNSCSTSSIHPASWNKTTYSTAKRPFMSLENSRNFISRATAGSKRNLISRVFERHEARWIDEVEHEFDMNLTQCEIKWTLFHSVKLSEIYLIVAKVYIYLFYYEIKWTQYDIKLFFRQIHALLHQFIRPHGIKQRIQLLKGLLCRSKTLEI